MDEKIYNAIHEEVMRARIQIRRNTIAAGPDSVDDILYDLTDKICEAVLRAREVPAYKFRIELDESQKTQLTAKNTNKTEIHFMTVQTTCVKCGAPIQAVQAENAMCPNCATNYGL